MLDLDKFWVDFTCSRCNYSDKTQLQEVKLESIIYCHNCKASIQLKDSNASAHTSIKKVNQEIQKITDIFKKIGK